MAVPRISQLRPGVGVNIVLKKDQQSGKLTRGRISEILTQGDHPRGVKVRLIDGSFGRVQSLSSDLDPSITVQNAPAAPTSRDMLNGSFENSTQQYGRAGRRGGKRESLLQENYSESSAPQQSRSLADYIKSPPSSKPASAPYRSIQGDTVQLQLEKDFPKLDTALIAAILSDHDDPEAARGILSSLD